MKIAWISALALLSFAPAAPAFAWGAAGHELVSGEAARALPEELPAFLRTEKAADWIAVLGRELDRSKGAGQPHDAERDPGHFLNLHDNGMIAGVLALDALPPTRAAYDAALNTLGSDQYRAGYLPYAILDGWQQLVKDFAYWRAARVGERTAKSAADRAWFAQDRARREVLTQRDLGVWSHYVGDASQPMHVSDAHDGWTAPDNPRRYQTQRGFHARFEGAYVRANITNAMVRAAIAPYRECGCSPEQRVKEFLRISNAQLMPAFELERRGAFPQPDAYPPQPGTPTPDPPVEAPTEAALADGRAFVASRLGAGAGEVRDLVVMAWRASATATVGWPTINVADIESGKVILRREDFGND